MDVEEFDRAAAAARTRTFERELGSSIDLYLAAAGEPTPDVADPQPDQPSQEKQD
jgi:hypothetical protein